MPYLFQNRIYDDYVVFPEISHRLDEFKFRARRTVIKALAGFVFIAVTYPTSLTWLSVGAVGYVAYKGIKRCSRTEIDDLAEDQNIPIEQLALIHHYHLYTGDKREAAVKAEASENMRLYLNAFENSASDSNDSDYDWESSESSESLEFEKEIEQNKCSRIFSFCRRS